MAHPIFGAASLDGLQQLTAKQLETCLNPLAVALATAIAIKTAPQGTELASTCLKAHDYDQSTPGLMFHLLKLGESLPAFAHSLGRLAWAEYVARTCYSDASQPGLVEEACTRSSGNFGMTPPALITSKTDFIPLAQSDENRAPTPVTTCTHLSIQAASAIYIAPPSLDTLDCYKCEDQHRFSAPPESRAPQAKLADLAQQLLNIVLKNFHARHNCTEFNRAADGLVRLVMLLNHDPSGAHCSSGTQPAGGPEAPVLTESHQTSTKPPSNGTHSSPALQAVLLLAIESALSSEGTAAGCVAAGAKIKAEQGASAKRRRRLSKQLHTSFNHMRPTSSSTEFHSAAHEQSSAFIGGLAAACLESPRLSKAEQPEMWIGVQHIEDAFQPLQVFMCQPKLGMSSSNATAEPQLSLPRLVQLAVHFLSCAGRRSTSSNTSVSQGTDASRAPPASIGLSLLETWLLVFQQRALAFIVRCLAELNAAANNQAAGSWALLHATNRMTHFCGAWCAVKAAVRAALACVETAELLPGSSQPKLSTRQLSQQVLQVLAKTDEFFASTPVQLPVAASSGDDSPVGDMSLQDVMEALCVPQGTY